MTLQTLLAQVQQAAQDAERDLEATRARLAAWERFTADPRVKGSHWRVYRYYRHRLDTEPTTSPKLETVATETGVDAADVSRALTALVDWGHLTEHPRGLYRERVFSLVGISPSRDSAPPRQEAA